MVLLLEGTEDGEIEVQITYVVTKARWTPKYDIRVFSNDGQLKVDIFWDVNSLETSDFDGKF